MNRPSAQRWPDPLCGGWAGHRHRQIVVLGEGDDYNGLAAHELPAAHGHEHVHTWTPAEVDDAVPILIAVAAVGRLRVASGGAQLVAASGERLIAIARAAG